MPHTGEFQAQVDAGTGTLRLSGDCRALDLDGLERALADWSRAGARTLDLTDVGRLDIGPAWLLERSIARAATSGRSPPTLTGERHSATDSGLVAGFLQADQTSAIGRPLRKPQQRSR